MGGQACLESVVRSKMLTRTHDPLCIPLCPKKSLARLLKEMALWAHF